MPPFFAPFPPLSAAILVAALAALHLPAPTFAQAPPPPAAPKPTPPAAVAAPTPSPAASGAMASAPVAPVPSPMAPAPPELTVTQVRVSGPNIAITFDDGPHPALTPQLLDLLKQKNIRSTFFVVGQMAKERPDLLKRAVAEGHEIANHSYSHPNLAKMSDDAVRSELTRTKELITAATGRPVPLMRPPYGSLSKAQQRWVHDDLGYKIILWDVDPLDWKRPGPDAITRRILEGTHKGSVILAHDIHAGTIQAMPATLDGLLEKGFKFVTVSELLAMALPPEPRPVSTAAGKGAPRPTGPAPLAPGMPEKLTGGPDFAPTPAPSAVPVSTPARR